MIVAISHPLNFALLRCFQFSSAKCIVTPEPNSTMELNAAKLVSNHGSWWPSTTGGQVGAESRR